MTAKKDDKKRDKNALNNFFPDASSEAVKGVGSLEEDGRLESITPEVEVVTMPASAVGKAVPKAEEEGEVTSKGAADKDPIEVDKEAVEIIAEADIEESIVNADTDDVGLAGEPPGVPGDTLGSLPDDDDQPLVTEKVLGSLERSDNEIAEALEQSEERKSDILIGLGFNRYDDNDGKIKYSVLENDIKIGVTFDEKTPEGNVWAIYKESTEGYKNGATEEGKEGTFLSPVARAQQPLLQRYYAILKGEETIPKPVIEGKVVEKRGGSIGIEFEEELGGPRTEYYPAEDAVKRDKEGYFIAKGFSKEWRDRAAKMHFPRAIRLPNYELELKDAPVSEPSGQEASKPDHSGTASTTPTHKREASRAPTVPTVTLEEKRQHISDNLNWAVGEAVKVYKEHVEGQVPMEEGHGVFIEKVAVTVFITLQKSLHCVEG